MFLQDSAVPDSSAQCWYKRFLPSLDVLPASRREQCLFFIPDSMQVSSVKPVSSESSPTRASL